MSRNNKKRYQEKKSFGDLPEYGFFYTDENGNRISETVTDQEEKAKMEELFKEFEVKDGKKIRK